MAYLAKRAAEKLVDKGIDAEVIDLRTIKPLDKELLIDSARKTGRLVIADGGWSSFGIAAEIEAVVFEEAFSYMKSSPVRVTLPDVPAPASASLEKAYYPTEQDIINAVLKVLS